MRAHPSLPPYPLLSLSLSPLLPIFWSPSWGLAPPGGAVWLAAVSLCRGGSVVAGGQSLAFRDCQVNEEEIALLIRNKYLTGCVLFWRRCKRHHVNISADKLDLKYLGNLWLTMPITEIWYISIGIIKSMQDFPFHPASHMWKFCLAIPELDLIFHASRPWQPAACATQEKSSEILAQIIPSVSPLLSAHWLHVWIHCHWDISLVRL